MQWEHLRFSDFILKKKMYGGEELANVGLKMEDKRDLVILTLSATPPPPQLTAQNQLNTLA